MFSNPTLSTLQLVSYLALTTTQSGPYPQKKDETYTGD